MYLKSQVDKLNMLLYVIIGRNKIILKERISYASRKNSRGKD